MHKNLENFLELVKQNNLQQIKTILLDDPTLIVQEYADGVVPPFIASEYGHFELVKYMMEYTRVSMNIWDSHHRSILHYCAKSDNRELFAYLVERISMNPLEVDMDLKTPLDYATEYDCKNIINYYKDILNIDKLHKNPIVTGAFPDPSFIRVNDDYYMVNSSFLYFPCIPILHSTDLINWKIIGHAVTNTDYIDLTRLENGRGFWAPDISYNNGKFYITATYRLNDNDNPVRLQMVVSSDKPEGPYCEPSFINEDGIDPSIFTDDDGKRYMLLNRGARIFQINKDGTEKIGEQKMLWYGNNKRAPEAPHLLKKDGYYYVFVSEGGTGRGHQISVARSKELMGVYENCPYNPIITQRDENHPLQRSGHGKMLQTQSGDWYISYLCGRMIDQKWSILGRETALDKVTWTNDGWPIVNELKGPSGAFIPPTIPQKINPTHFDYKGFIGLNCDWHFSRNPVVEYLDVQNDKITYTAGNKDLCELDARNVLVQRQTKFNFESTVLINVDIDKFYDNCQAILTCYYDTNSYIKYFITKKKDEFFIGLTERIGLEEINHNLFKVDFNGKIILKNNSNMLDRDFSYSLNGQDFINTHSLKNVTYLSDEGVSLGKRFTGAMIGIFALSERNDNLFTITFDNFTNK